MQSDLAEGKHLHQESQTDMWQTDAGQTDQGGADRGQQSQGQHTQGQADQGQANRGQAHQGQVNHGLADLVQADRGQTGRVHDDDAVEVGPGPSAGRRMTRASARQVSLLQDMHASGACHLLQQKQGALAAVTDIACHSPPRPLLGVPCIHPCL